MGGGWQYRKQPRNGLAFRPALSLGLQPKGPAGVAETIPFFSRWTPAGPMVMEVARARVMAFSMGKEGQMWDALKKLIGADEKGKKRRQELGEQERLEREERARQHAKKLKHDADEVKRSEDS